jgi:hypothetical protein
MWGHLYDLILVGASFQYPDTEFTLAYILKGLEKYQEHSDGRAICPPLMLGVRNKMKTKAFVILIALALAGCTTPLDEPNERLANLLDPPDDLFVPLFQSELSLRAPISITADVTHKHSGTHEIQLAVPGEHWPEQLPALRSAIVVADRGTSVFTSDIENRPGRFSTQESFYTLARYICSDDVPLRRVVEIRITVSEIPSEVQQLGNGRLLITKVSDK